MAFCEESIRSFDSNDFTAYERMNISHLNIENFVALLGISALDAALDLKSSGSGTVGAKIIRTPRVFPCKQATQN